MIGLACAFSTGRLRCRPPSCHALCLLHRDRIEYRTTCRYWLATLAALGAGAAGTASMWVDYATFQATPLAPPHIRKREKPLESSLFATRQRRLKIFLTLE
jgi:hypothetical protein